MITFASAFIALYVGHHVGDYWVQTDHQAGNKGKAGSVGRWACSGHVFSYLLTQSVCLSIVRSVTGEEASYWPSALALLVSGVTHYMADRREFGFMFWVARKLGKTGFMRLGAPRGGHYDDNPSFTTGAWALDQSWHLFFGCFMPALVIGGLS